MRRLLTTVALAGAGALFSALLVVSPAQAAHHSDPAAQAKHFAECLDLMINNATKHAQLCGPGHEWTGKFSNGWNMEGDHPAPKKDPCKPPPCCWHPCCEGGEVTYGRRAA